MFLRKFIFTLCDLTDFCLVWYLCEITVNTFRGSKWPISHCRGNQAICPQSRTNLCQQLVQGITLNEVFGRSSWGGCNLGTGLHSTLLLNKVHRLQVQVLQLPWFSFGLSKRTACTSESTFICLSMGKIILLFICLALKIKFIGLQAFPVTTFPLDSIRKHFRGYFYFKGELLKNHCWPT